jgi:uncharacterized OsmC-like protein
MAEGKVKTRQAGAAATLSRAGRPQIVTDTGGTLDVATRPTEPGFSPLDLLYASLASCLVLSARIAASRLGMLDRLDRVRVHVTGEKAEDEPSRIERLEIVFEIEGDLDEAARRAIAEAAEGDICTVSNTLRRPPRFASRDA